MWVKKLNRYISALERFNVPELMRRFTARSQIRKWIKDENRTRLWKSGTYADGSTIRTYRAAAGAVYARRTIAIKKEQKLPFNRVTLYQTGAFHRSIKVKVDNMGFAVTGQWNKRRGKISDNLDTRNLLGLTRANRSGYMKMVRRVLVQALRRRLR